MKYRHNLSHYKLGTGNQGYLIPVGCYEALPGDLIRDHSTVFMRTSPLLAPVMHPVHVTIHKWFVPTRILWEDFENFITGGEDGENASVHPYITTPAVTGFAEGSLADYLGVTPDVPNLQVSALPFRAYNTIFNEWYRDTQLQPLKVAVSKASGSDTVTSTGILQRAWEKDRFTSARPDPQLGPEVTVPLGDTAPLERIPNAPVSHVYQAGNNTLVGVDVLETNTGGVTWLPPATNVSIDNHDAMRVDLSDATAATINELREAFAIQRFQENRSRYGGRYPEYLRMMGVNPRDSRLQRPEYLGGGKQTLQFSEVLQTAPAEIDSETTPVGNMAGHGINATSSRPVRYYAEEHGFVITLLSVKPVTMYAQGISKMWSRQTKFDYFQPELQHIGQEAVKVKEVYAAAADPNLEFGWNDRYDDYRRIESSISGEMRTTQQQWHMARIFSSEPALNADFIRANPTDRIYAAGSTQDQLLFMVNHKIHAKRLVAPTGNSFIR